MLQFFLKVGTDALGVDRSISRLESCAIWGFQKVSLSLLLQGNFCVLRPQRDLGVKGCPS